MILVFSGNRIDAPGRTPPRFPPDREEAVGARLAELLDLIRPDGVVTAAAAGADILFAEAAIERKLPLHLVLTCSADRFEEVSVADQGTRWTAAYRRVLEYVASDNRCSLVELCLEPDDAGFRSTNQLLIERARGLDASVLAVVVRPRERNCAPSMTDDFVDRAHGAGLFVVEIDPRHDQPAT